MFQCRRYISLASRRVTPNRGDGAARGPSLRSMFREEIGAMDRRESARHNAAAATRASESNGEPTNAELSLYESALPAGRVYSPEDLSFDAKRPLRQATRLASVVDKFESHQIKPRDQYKSYNLLGEYITDLGRIRPREQTGLSAKNQRALAKSVRRARALSLLPSTSKHPLKDASSARMPSTNWIARSY